MPRRRLLAGNCCGGDCARQESGWAFTDDRGETTSLPTKPTSINTQTISAAGLWDFGVDVAGIYGPFRVLDGSPESATGSIDPDAQRYVGINRGQTPC